MSRVRHRNGTGRAELGPACRRRFRLPGSYRLDGCAREVMAQNDACAITMPRDFDRTHLAQADAMP